jgi:hypothetical protein
VLANRLRRRCRVLALQWIWGFGQAARSCRFGGKAMPAAWKTLPTWPATAVRVVMRLPSFSIVASWRRSRSRNGSTHSITKLWLWHRSASSFLQHQGEERAEHTAANGGITGMINRAGPEDRLGAPHHVFDLQQIAVALAVA